MLGVYSLVGAEKDVDRVQSTIQQPLLCLVYLYSTTRGLGGVSEGKRQEGVKGGEGREDEGEESGGKRKRYGEERTRVDGEESGGRGGIKEGREGDGR